VPLLEKEKLEDAAQADLGRQFLARCVQSRWLASGQFARPFLPASPGVTLTQGVKKDEVFQPP